MSNYSIALFLHIVGALGFFIVLGLEWIGLSRIRSAILPEEARAILGVVNSTNRLGMISMPTTIITGIYMLLTVWGWVPWLIVVLGALVLEIVLFVVLTRPRMAAVEQALVTEKRPFSQSFRNLVNHPILWISVQTRVAIILGIVYLKIAQPDLGGSLLTIGIAIVLGLASTLPTPRRVRVQEGPAD
jgi:MFS family permease